MEFNYPHKSEADGYVDYFSVNGGEILFESQDTLVRVGCSGYSNVYRTITSSIFFSVFESIPARTTREELLAVYMDYLTGATGITEGYAEAAPDIVTVANPARGSFNAVIELQECVQCNLDLFDLSGRMVGSFCSGTLPQGTHNLIISGSTFSAGTYFIRGTVGEQDISLRTVFLK